MYKVGRGVLQANKEAVKWYRKAAVQDYEFAQFQIGWMHEVGKGISQNRVKAHMWYNIAARNGYENAVRGRSRIEAFLTNLEVSGAHGLAKHCLASGYKQCD